MQACQVEFVRQNVLIDIGLCSIPYLPAQGMLPPNTRAPPCSLLAPSITAARTFQKDSQQLQEDLPALYRGHDAFLFTSRYEAWGMPVLEAMASGLAVVATRCLGVESFAQHGTNCLLADPQVRHKIVKVAAMHHIARWFLAPPQRNCQHIAC